MTLSVVTRFLCQHPPFELIACCLKSLLHHKILAQSRCRVTVDETSKKDSNETFL